MPFTISIRGAPSSNSNYLVDTQRQYVPQYNFMSVESSVTDFGGDTVTHLIQGSVVYNFIISQNGVPVAIFNNSQVKCNNIVTGDCSITLPLSQASAGVPDFNNYGNISQVYFWDNNSRTESMTWTVTDGNVHTVTQTVTQSGNQICSGTQVGTSGTIYCSVPINYGNDTLATSVVVDGSTVGGTPINIGQTPGDIFGGTRVILVALMYSSLVMLFIANPVFIVLGAVFGMMFGAILFLISGVTIGTVIATIGFFVIGGFLLAWQIGRRSQ